MMTLMTAYGDDAILVVVVIVVDVIFIIVIVIDVVAVVIVIDVGRPFISRRSFCRFFLPPGPESKMR